MPGRRLGDDLFRPRLLHVLRCRSETAATIHVHLKVDTTYGQPLRAAGPWRRGPELREPLVGGQERRVLLAEAEAKLRPPLRRIFLEAAARHARHADVLD